MEKAKNAAVVPARMGPWLIRHRDCVTRPLIKGFLDAVRKIPGTGKVGAIGFCWGDRHAILLDHGPSPDEAKIGSEGVDAAVVCHPSGVSIPDDLEPVTKPLSIALGSKDSLVDMSSAGTIKDILDAKKEVPHQIQVYIPLSVFLVIYTPPFIVSSSPLFLPPLEGSGLRMAMLTQGLKKRFMKIKSTASR